jgi:PrcB C-terminal
MTPTHVTSLLSDYIEGTLPAVMVEKVKSHLIFCNPCRNNLVEVKRNITLLKSTVTATPPAHLADKIISNVLSDTSEIQHMEPAHREIKFPRLFTLRNMAFLTASVVAFLVVMNMPDSIGDKNQTKTEPIAPQRRISSEAEVSGLSQPLLANPEVAKVTADKKENTLPVANMEFGALAAGSKKTSAMAEEIDSVPIEKQSSSDEFRKQEEPEKFDKDNLFKGRTAPAGNATAFEGLDGPMSGVTAASEQIISSESEWKELWTSDLNRQFPNKTIPFVNFEQNDVVAIFLGSKPSGGYSVQITRIVETAWNGKPAQLVRYREQAPTSQAFTTSVITTPFLLKVLPKFNGRTYFRKSP